LVAFTLATTLPLVLERRSIALHAVLVVCGSLLPVLGGMVLARLSGVSGRAVWWTPKGELACTNQRWAAELSARNGAHMRVAELRPPRSYWWIGIGPAFGLLLAGISYPFHHPFVRIINLTPSRLTIRVDGELVAELEPTSAESTRAGIERRVPAGARVLEARDASGRVVSRADVVLESGARHLFAPGSDGYCFWLESTHYGRSAAPVGNVVVPLSSESQFWVLKNPIDTWFAPNPPPSSADERSTGGVLTALRQAPCGEAPESPIR
jgi:hypothetical protein